MSDKIGREVEYIQISLDESVEKIPLSKVRKILRTFQEDVYDYNHKHDKKRLGKILTIIDGSIADQTQRKAIKDMINDAWYGDRWVEGHNHYPRLDQATEAIGFSLYDKMAQPSIEPAEVQNKYKEV